MVLFELLLFIAAGVVAGHLTVRYLPVRPLAHRAAEPDELRRLRLERDRLRLELDGARCAPGGSDLATDVRVEHLKSAVHAAKRRIAELEDELGEARRMIVAVAVDPAAGRVAGVPPERLEGPDGPPDDLKRITGIGPGIERKLNEIGIFHFTQIAALEPANIEWLDQHLPVRGRLQREDWVGQARRLIADGPEAERRAELQPAL